MVMTARIGGWLAKQDDPVFVDFDDLFRHGHDEAVYMGVEESGWASGHC
jgi:hypothetical protein